MPSHRCKSCEVFWPTHLNLKTCPECDGQLLASQTDPMESEDAYHRKLYADFERYWNKWTPENADPRVKAEAEAEVERRLAERRQLEALLEDAA